jgi:hypothetical protein
MDKASQTELLEELIDGMKYEMLTRIKNIPDNWDGFEIRQWIVDYAKTHIAWKEMDKSRKRAYNNDITIRNIT